MCKRPLTRLWEQCGTGGLLVEMCSMYCTYGLDTAPRHPYAHELSELTLSRFFKKSDWGCDGMAVTNLIGSPSATVPCYEHV